MTLVDQNLFPEKWNPALGAWFVDEPGHTADTHTCKRVHILRDAAERLLAAAEVKQLHAVPVDAVLNALAGGQWLPADRSDPLYGCFKWYVEDTRPRDTNAAFFVALPLIALWLRHHAKLNDAQRKLLRTVFDGLQVWFDRQMAHRSFRYPNKYLGDLVCAWLLREIRLNAAPDDVTAWHDAAAYWRTHHWGWGEHLSDLYAGICIDELSLFLLAARHLPDDLRQAYSALLRDLIDLNDLFAGGPRVPALRCYAFDHAPVVGNYRNVIRSADDELISALRPGSAPTIFQRRVVPSASPLRCALHALGWHELAGDPPPVGRGDFTVSCFGATSAFVSITNTLRFGAMSRFPLMLDAERPTWGLSWQCFPVSFWHSAGAWGFLQWASTQAESDTVRRRGHPAFNKADSYRDNALSTDHDPPIVGRTVTHWHDGVAFVLRVMPARSALWTSLTDSLQLIGLQQRPEQLADRIVRLPLGEESVDVACCSLGNGRPRDLLSDGDHHAWTMQFDLADANQPLTCLWVFSLRQPIDSIEPISATSIACTIAGRKWTIDVQPELVQGYPSIDVR